jgi:hypothetical protein
MNLKKIITIGAVAASTLVAVAPANAVVTIFAAFNSIGNTRNIRWVGTGSNAVFYTTATGNANTAGSKAVNFSFLQSALAPYATNKTAIFTLNGTVTNKNATISGSDIMQSNISGTFSFILAAGQGNTINIGPNISFGAGTNLLSGTFTLATISGNRNGSSAGFSASSPVSTITYTSDVLDFVNGSNYDFALSLTSINPLLNATNASNQTTGTPNKALRSFRALVGGQFSSDPAPITPAIPEPASWMLLIVGFGMVGVSARARKTSVVA